MTACERCVYGTGQHLEGCPSRPFAASAAGSRPPLRARIRIGDFGIRFVDEPDTYPTPQEFLFLRA